MNSNEPTQCAEAEKENELTQKDQSPSESCEKGHQSSFGVCKKERADDLGQRGPEDCPIGIVIA